MNKATESSPSDMAVLRSIIRGLIVCHNNDEVIWRWAGREWDIDKEVALKMF